MVFPAGLGELRGQIGESGGAEDNLSVEVFQVIFPKCQNDPCLAQAVKLFRAELLGLPPVVQGDAGARRRKTEYQFRIAHAEADDVDIFSFGPGKKGFVVKIHVVTLPCLSEF